MDRWIGRPPYLLMIDHGGGRLLVFWYNLLCQGILIFTNFFNNFFLSIPNTFISLITLSVLNSQSLGYCYLHNCTKLSPHIVEHFVYQSLVMVSCCCGNTEDFEEVIKIEMVLTYFIFLINSSSSSSFLPLMSNADRSIIT